MGISIKQLEEERVVLAKTFDDLNIKIKQVEGETQKMRNNLNALAGAIQQCDMFLKQLAEKDAPMPAEKQQALDIATS